MRARDGKGRFISSACVGGALITLIAGTWAGSWPGMPLPPQSRVAWVGDDLTINGVATRIQSFSSDLDAAAVLAYFRAQWGADGGKFVENRVNGWRVIGRREGNYYTTVQVRVGTESGSQGFVAASEFPDAMRAMPAADAFPSPVGTEVLSDLRTADPGKHATTLLLRNHQSVGGNARFYRRTLPAQGWRELAIEAASQQGGQVQVMRFDRPRKAAQIVVQADRGGGSLITVNVENTEGGSRQWAGAQVPRRPGMAGSGQ